MRRSERELPEKSVLDAIIRESTVCRLALSVASQPYIVPLSFGYEQNHLYFHGASEGRKLDMLAKNSRVCFEFDSGVEVLENEQACGWSMKYQSVIGFGAAHLVTDHAEKVHALTVIMGQYSGRTFSFPDNVVENTAVIKVEIKSMTAKASGGLKADDHASPAQEKGP